jgi:hypothetical protein
MISKLRRMNTWFLPSVLPIGIIVFYAIPALASIVFKGDPYGKYILTYSMVSLFFFIAVWVLRLDMPVVGPLMGLRKLPVNIEYLAYGVVALYFLFTVYVAYTAPAVPLFDAVRQEGIDVLALGRETFLRARTGWESGLNYAYAMFRSFLMPFAVCMLYHKRLRMRHVVLIAFLVSLMLTLEKSVAIFALLPVFYLFAQRQNYRGAAMIVVLTLLSMGTTAYLARGGVSSVPVVVMTSDGKIQSATESNLDPHNLPKNAKIIQDPRQSMAYLPKQYNIFTGDSQIEYILNRIFYIPYITAHEWIRYQDERLNGGHTYGRSISLIAYIMGEPKINLEREVFNFQWGQNNTGTGTANSAYFIDAVLNIGVLGCFLYTFVTACIIRMATLSRLRVMEACIFVPTLFLLFNSLTAMIFSGGLFLMIIFSLTLTDKDEAKASVRADPALA